MGNRQVTHLLGAQNIVRLKRGFFVILIQMYAHDLRILVFDGEAHSKLRFCEERYEDEPLVTAAAVTEVSVGKGYRIQAQGGKGILSWCMCSSSRAYHGGRGC